MSNESDTANNSEAPKSQKKGGAGVPFKKADPRINRLGRPRGYDEARKAAIAMLGEKIVSADGRKAVSRFQMIMMDWLSSRNFQKQKAALELAGFFAKGGENLSMNVDLRALTNAQLEQLAAGVDIYTVLLNKS
jgi:hypothetical protein